jgi:hypothetical protein
MVSCLRALARRNTDSAGRVAGSASEHEGKILLNRIPRDNPCKSDMNNRQALNLFQLWKVVTDWEQLPLSVFGILIYISPAPPSTYLSYVLRKLGFSVF